MDLCVSPQAEVNLVGEKVVVVYNGVAKKSVGCSQLVGGSGCS